MTRGGEKLILELLEREAFRLVRRVARLRRIAEKCLPLRLRHAK